MRNEENKYYKSLQICEVVFHKQKLSNITNITKKTKPQNQTDMYPRAIIHQQMDCSTRCGNNDGGDKNNS